MEYVSLLQFLLLAHYLADYPLQGDFLSKAKNPSAPIPGVPWYQAMFAHAMIHSGFVFLITSSIWIAMFEVVVHFIIDYLKCKGKLSFNMDQLLHIVCKVGYVLIMFLYHSTI